MMDLPCLLAVRAAASRHGGDAADVRFANDKVTVNGRVLQFSTLVGEAYLDRACSRHLSQAGETQVFQGEGSLTLDTGDFMGVAAELEP